MKPTTIFFVRHGEVDNPRDIVYLRSPRFHLSERGRRESLVTARFLKREPITAVYSSPMLRARQTAQIIHNYHPAAPVHISKHLNELKSSYQGVTRAEMEKIGWNFYDNRLRDDDETREDLLARAQRQARLTWRQHAGESVVWVAHGDLIIMMTVWGKGLPLLASQAYKNKTYIGH
ncbi:MAG: histidine phosphatase family protein, partial [Chloroflexi bacterium]|nr:histidine phosphatase family protein [Chloroflexota bacterium]